MATPAISPNGGTFTSSLTVTVTDATAGAVLHCTTDGSTPNASSPSCASNTFTKTTTLKAYATESGYTDSSVISVTFTLNVPQVATPVISPNGGTFTSAQNVSITDTTPGATISYTVTSGSVTGPSTTYSAAFMVSATSTVTATATASGYTPSTAATATFTIDVPQTVSLPATIGMNLNDVLKVDTIITASSSCPPSKVTYLLASPAGTDTTVNGASVLASYAADPTGNTNGTLNAGNAPRHDGGNTYTFTATCGSATSSSTLTVLAAVPTVSSATPDTIKPTGGTLTLTGKNFAANNSRVATEYVGTLVASMPGACPKSVPLDDGGGSSWQDSTDIKWSFTATGSGAALGSNNVTVMNPPTAAGNDGGQSCTPNVYSVTATGMIVKAQNVISFNPENGLLRIQNKDSGAVMYSYNLGARTTLTEVAEHSMIVVGNTAYITEPSVHSVAAIDLQTGALTHIAFPGLTPIAFGEGPGGTIYAAAIDSSDSNHAAIYRIMDSSVTKVVSADGITSLATKDSSLFWTVPSEDGTSTTVHEYDLNAAKEMHTTIGRSADKVSVLSDGSFVVYHSGSTKATVASVLNLYSFTEQGTVRFASGILSVNAEGMVALSDGDIGTATIHSDANGKPELAWQLFSHEAEPAYGGFATSVVNGIQKLYVMHRSTVAGELLPVVESLAGKQ